MKINNIFHVTNLKEKKFYLSIALEPPKTLRVNKNSIINILKSALQSEIQNNSFLLNCGIQTTVKHQRIGIEFNPIFQMKLNPLSVTNILKSLLIYKIDENDFLKSCKIKVLAEEEGYAI